MGWLCQRRRCQKTLRKRQLSVRDVLCGVLASTKCSPRPQGRKCVCVPSSGADSLLIHHAKIVSAINYFWE